MSLQFFLHISRWSIYRLIGSFSIVLTGQRSCECRLSKTSYTWQLKSTLRFKVALHIGNPSGRLARVTCRSTGWQDMTFSVQNWRWTLQKKKTEDEHIRRRNPYDAPGQDLNCVGFGEQPRGIRGPPSAPPPLGVGPVVGFGRNPPRNLGSRQKRTRRIR